MSKVEWKRLGDVCDITTGNCNKEDAVENGRFPFFVRSKEVFRINRYLFDEEAVIIPGEGGIGDIFHYVKGKYGLHQRAYRIHPKVNDIYCKFIYYYLVTNFKQYICQKSVSATVTSIRKPMLEAFCFPKPLPKVQQQIVEQLDIFTTLIAKLESELALRQKQYEFYREELLNFDGDEEVEWKTLGDLFDFRNGLNKEKEAFGYGVPIINYTDVYANRGLKNNNIFGKVSLSKTEIERFQVKRGDIFFTRTSETKEEVGYPSVLLEDIENCTFSGFLIKGTPTTSSLYPEYCKYCFITYDVRRIIYKKASLTTRALINGEILRSISIPIPPMHRQQQIVSQLDTFEQLIAALKREIALRRKQYEFYREKLLTFE